MKLKNVVVQIPCLNEEEGIGQVIKQIKKENSNFRIIVYDNGSIDKSVDIVKKNNVEVRHVRKKGKGNVVRQMFSEQIDADYYIMVDGDNTYDISNINFMLNSMIKYNYDNKSTHCGPGDEAINIINIPPKEVSINDADSNFLGENLSARIPPKIYDRNATKPYVENNAPSCKLDKLNTSKKVGLKILARTYGNIYIDSAARINVKRYL